MNGYILRIIFPVSRKDSKFNGVSMTNTEIQPVKESSLYSPWHWYRKDFEKQWEYLINEGLFSEKKGNTIWQTRFKNVQLLDVPAGEDSYKIVLKFYREKRIIRYILRPSLAAREAMGYQVMEKLGIPVAEVLAYGENRNFFRIKEAFIITKYVEGTENMLCFRNRPDEHETLLTLLKENIRYLAKLHKANYIHSGLHPRNILWKRTEDGGVKSIWIDLATVRNVEKHKKYWKYILTDLSDLTEVFLLSREELDMLMSEYRKIHNIAVGYKIRKDHERKFSEAYEL